MTASRIALNTLAAIVQKAAAHGPRVQFLAETAIQRLVIGGRVSIHHLTCRERVALFELGFSIRVVLVESRAKKDLCEVTIR